MILHFALHFWVSNQEKAICGDGKRNFIKKINPWLIVAHGRPDVNDTKGRRKILEGLYVVESVMPPQGEATISQTADNAI